MNSLILSLNKEKKFLIFVFIFSFLIRILFFHFFLSSTRYYFTADSSGYHDVAVQIAKGKGISNADRSPNFFRLPGYPLFLSAFYKIFNFNEKKALVGQIVLSCLIPLLIFCLSLVLFSGNIFVAKICAIIASVHLGFLIFSGLLMSETLFMVLFLFFCIFFFNSRILEAGIFLGLATLVRPVGHYVLVISIILLFILSFKFFENLKKALLLFVAWALVISWWLLRNFLLTGMIFLNTLPGKHFLNHTATYVVMNLNKCSYADAKKKLSEELTQDMKGKESIVGRALTEIEQCKIAENLAFKYLRANKWLTIKYGGMDVARTAFSPFSEEFFFMEKKAKNFWPPNLSNNFFVVFFYIELIFLLFIFVGVGGFVYQAVFNPYYQKILLKVFPLNSLFLIITFASGFARLRLPLEPFLIIFAVVFWAYIFKSNDVVAYE